MIVLIGFVLAFGCLASGKTYERCELARELKHVHGAPANQIATWVCIARHESEYNTSAVGSKNGDGSKDHGIFQISDKFWCSPPGTGWACGLTCAMLEDDDIADDFVCANKIYKEHKHLQGDGFKAWTVYETLCKGPMVQQYIEGCFSASDEAATHRPKTTTKKAPHKTDTSIANRIDVPTVPKFPKNRIATDGNKTERKIPVSTPSVFQQTLQQSQKRESVFIINGQTWP